MKPKPNPNFPSGLFLGYSIVAGTLSLALGLFSFNLIRKGLIAGRIFSPTVVFSGDGTMVYRRDSPAEYWSIVGICFLGGLIGCVLGVWAPVGTARAYIERLARRKKERIESMGADPKG